MVAKITTGKSIFGALAYNERKVQAGEAVTLGAINSMANAGRQGLHEKAQTLQSLADRNARTTRNTYHIALSFAPDDKLSAEEIRTIAREYLVGIGFEAQPAYIYRHHDTANDHIHIVTTNIRVDGSRINDSFIGRTKSEETRRAIEIKHDLVKAEDQPKRETKQTARVSLKAQARHTITGTFKEAKPSTVGELNTLLREQGLKVIERTGTTRKGEDYRGFLVTRINPRTGQETGASIKASKVFEAGWSEKTDRQLAENGIGKAKQLKRVRRVVKDSFAQRGLTAEELRKDLADRGVRTIEHRNEQGFLYGMTYLDQKTGYLFKASEIGKGYSAASWRERADTDRLGEGQLKHLEENLKGYMHLRTEQLGLRSAAIKRLSLYDLQEHVAKEGFKLQAATPHLKEFIVARQKTYDYYLRRDQDRLLKVQRGIERLKPEYRRGVSDAAGIVEVKGRGTHRFNQDIELDLPTDGAGPVKLEMERLTAQEKVVLKYAGQQGGVGGIPQRVHVQNVDWKFWKDKFGDHLGQALEEKLYGNYLRTHLQKAGRSAKPVDYLLKRGIIVEKLTDGHITYVHDCENYRVLMSRKASRQVDGQNYQEKDFERVRTNMSEPVVADVLNHIRALNNPHLRSENGGQLKKQLEKTSKVLSSTKKARTELASYIGSKSEALRHRGLYDILQRNAEEEETPQQRQTRKQQRL